jgi:hypothetical protein
MWLMVWKGSALPPFGSRSLPSRPHTGRTLFNVSGVPIRPLPFVQMFHFFGDVDHKADPAYCCPFPKFLKLSNLRSFAL